jgi:hypothetical protein
MGLVGRCGLLARVTATVWFENVSEGERSPKLALASGPGFTRNECALFFTNFMESWLVDFSNTPYKILFRSSESKGRSKPSSNGVVHERVALL